MASTDPQATAQLTLLGSGKRPPPAGGPAAQRSRKLLLTVLAAVIVLGGATAAALLVMARKPAPVQAASYQFATLSNQHGLSVTQLWTLAAPDGSSLEVTLTVSNSTSKPVTAELVEPVPAAVARDLSTLSFSGAAKYQTTGGLVVWDIPLPARGHAVVRYQVPEAASGVSQARLMRWVEAYYELFQQQALHLIAPRGVLWTVWIAPLNLRLSVGQSDKLEVHARLHNRELAPRADLQSAVWTTANPAVLFVNSSGQVIALSPGRALVWVQLGGIRASATVVVVGGGGQVLPPPYSQPPVQQSVSPSPTGPSPTSGSPTPTSPTPTSPTPTSPTPTSPSPSAS